MDQKTESIITGIKANPQRWQRLKEILADALEQSSLEERTAVLRQSCSDDTTLFREAEKLLSHDTRAFEEFAEFAAVRLRHAYPDRIGERIGAYVVVQELGCGGMGIVYLAERADGQFKKRVAIKVLKRGTDTDEVLRRFRIERQILANLEHPNITRLLDAGTTTDSLPYFVMEFIEGTPITDFVQREDVDLRGRLKLFLKVCSAVDLAHRNHIIHRDIKPGNVLVKPDSEPKLLDFGIAKLLDVDLDNGVTTIVIEQRLTPRYAAPEQRAGQPATVATDVYSLGALLQQLLTDTLPCTSSDIRGSKDNVSRFSNQRHLPNDSVADARMKDEVVGQLDRIVAKAMQPDPSRRYSSVTDLSEDIERCLDETSFSPALRRWSGNPTVRSNYFRNRYIAVAVLAVIVAAAAVVARKSRINWPQNAELEKTTPASSPGTAVKTVRSIAVLPFEPLGKDTHDELLGLGMADAVIGRMSTLKELVVLPTTAVSRYKGPANDPLAAGRALGVDAILSGTVQRSGDRVRATVQLVRVASGRTVWSEKFDQTFTNIFDVQDSISDSVAKSLALNLSANEQKQLAKRYTTNAAAYDEYLMGLYFWNMRSRDGLEKAIGHFGRAVEKDPNYALAYALMADCYFLQLYYGYSSAPDRIPNAKAAADRALGLDDSIAEAYVAAAMVQFRQKNDQHAESDHQAAMGSLRRAVALNPNLAIAHQRYAWALCAFGHLDEAVREMKRAQELDPLSHTNNTALGTMLVFARQFRDALKYCYKAAELMPNEGPIQENLALTYALNGMYQQAIEHYQRLGELNPEKKGDVLAFIAGVLVSAGRKSESDAMMPEILDLAAAGKADPYNLAVLYGARNEKDAAFEWFAKSLQSAPERRSNGIDSRTIRYDPMLDPLRSDSRFAGLLRQHNMGSLLQAPDSR